MKTSFFKFFLLIYIVHVIVSCSSYPEQKVEEKHFICTMPKGWKEIIKSQFEWTDGDEYIYSTSYYGSLLRPGVMDFQIFVIPVNKAFIGKEEMDRFLSDPIEYLYEKINPMGMSSFEYDNDGKELEESIKFFEFKGRLAAEHVYIEKNEPYDPKKGERSSYKKGKAIVFECNSNWIILHFSGFENQWNENQKVFQSIADSFIPKCD